MKLSRYTPTKICSDEWIEGGSAANFEPPARGVTDIEATPEGVVVTMGPVRQRDGKMLPGRLIFSGGGHGRIDDSKGPPEKKTGRLAEGFDVA